MNFMEPTARTQIAWGGCMGARPTHMVMQNQSSGCTYVQPQPLCDFCFGEPCYMPCQFGFCRCDWNEVFQGPGGQAAYSVRTNFLFMDSLCCDSATVSDGSNAVIGKLNPLNCLQATCEPCGCPAYLTVMKVQDVAGTDLYRVKTPKVGCCYWPCALCCCGPFEHTYHIHQGDTNNDAGGQITMKANREFCGGFQRDLHLDITFPPQADQAQRTLIAAAATRLNYGWGFLLRGLFCKGSADPLPDWATTLAGRDF